MKKILVLVLNYVFGHIRYTDWQLEMLKNDGVNITGMLNDVVVSEPEDTNRAAFNRLARKWISPWNGNTENGLIILYKYENEASFSPEERNLIRNALRNMKEYMNKCIKFWNIADLNPGAKWENENYIQIISNRNSGCWSMLGMTGSDGNGRQDLSLGYGCVTQGTVQHEFLHALGFTHEQNRSDRDDYIEINWNKIPNGWEGQFQKIPEKYFDSLGEKYDIHSVMQYSGYMNGQCVMSHKYTGQCINDPRNILDRMSTTDVLQLATLYSEFCEVPIKYKCPTKDSFGQNREVLDIFTQDGRNDCPDGSDESRTFRPLE